MERIKCMECGAESFVGVETKLACRTCYDKLETKNERLRQAIRRSLPEMKKQTVTYDRLFEALKELEGEAHVQGKATKGKTWIVGWLVGLVPKHLGIVLVA